MKKNQSQIFKPSLDEMILQYENLEAVNDSVHEALTKATWKESILAEHRGFIEQNKMGFGDAAFHSMWARILEAAINRHKKVRALEIGVFKGQVISLWALLAKTFQWQIEITAISPLKGTPKPRLKIVQKIKSIVSKKFREKVNNGDFYENENYEKSIHELLLKFKINPSNIRILKGFSTDKKIIEKTKELKFEILYVDGDHTFDGAFHDFRVFGEKVVKGGWLIADDAGCGLPGSKFWKGHEAVSRAAEILPSLGFKNVFNVGHNRIFERISDA